MVSNSVLAAVSVHHGLHKFLMIESESVKNAIDKYVPELEENQREEYALAEKEGRMPGQYWLEVDPPKVCIVAIICNPADLSLVDRGCRRVDPWSNIRLRWLQSRRCPVDVQYHPSSFL